MTTDTETPVRPSGRLPEKNYWERELATRTDVLRELAGAQLETTGSLIAWVDALSKQVARLERRRWRRRRDPEPVIMTTIRIGLIEAAGPTGKSETTEFDVPGFQGTYGCEGGNAAEELTMLEGETTWERWWYFFGGFGTASVIFNVIAWVA